MVVVVEDGQLALHRAVDVWDGRLLPRFPCQVEGHSAPVRAPHHDTVRKDATAFRACCEQRGQAHGG